MSNDTTAITVIELLMAVTKLKAEVESLSRENDFLKKLLLDKEVVSKIPSGGVIL